MSTLSSPKEENHEISANFIRYKVKIQNIPNYYYEIEEEIKNVFEDWKVNHPLELGHGILQYFTTIILSTEVNLEKPGQ